MARTMPTMPTMPTEWAARVAPCVRPNVGQRARARTPARRSRSRARTPRDAASFQDLPHTPTADPLLSSRDVICTHRPPCPGCPRFGEPGIARPAEQALNDLAVGHGLPDVSVISGASRGFRHRARLAIRGRVGSPKVGLFELGTHHVVHIPSCIVQHPLINRVAAVVRKALANARIPSYSDTAHLGLARYLQVVVERASQTAQVVVVANGTDPGPLAGCMDVIQDQLGSELHSLWWNGNSERTNTILGPKFERWSGPESVIEHFGGAAVHYPP